MSKAKNPRNTLFKTITTGVFISTWVVFTTQIAENAYVIHRSNPGLSLSHQFMGFAMILSVLLVGLYGYLRSKGEKLHRIYSASLFGIVNFTATMTASIVIDYLVLRSSYTSNYVGVSLVTQALVFLLSLVFVHRTASQIES